MKIIRYSTDGFKCQYQSHHINGHVTPFLDVETYIKDLEKVCPDHLIRFCKDVAYKQHNFVMQYKDLLQSGVWAFIAGYKCNQSLNHLNHMVPCWEAEIDDDIDVVGVNWDELWKIDDPVCQGFGFFIPEQNMSSLRRIKRVIRRVA